MNKTKEQCRHAFAADRSRNNVKQTLDAALALPSFDVSFRVNPGSAPGKLVADEEYVLEVKLSSQSSNRRSQFKANRFGRPVSEGYWLVIGEQATGELLALKRLGGLRGRETRVGLSFFTPEEAGEFVHTLYVISDCYLGLDQQYDFALVVTEPPPEGSGVEGEGDDPASEDYNDGYDD